MQIDFLYFEDCPSHEKALARLREVLHEEGLQAEIRIHKMETDEQAQEWRFAGSPTILVNGEDIVPTDETLYSLSCRVYQWEAPALPTDDSSWPATSRPGRSLTTDDLLHRPGLHPVAETTGMD